MFKPVREQEAVRGNAQGGVMMKAAPAPSLVVAQAELLLEILIIAFNAPAHLGGLDQIQKRGVGRQRRQPILGRFGLTDRPFDQQPLLRTWSAQPLLVAVSRADSDRGKARGQFLVGSLAPVHRAPSLGCQRFGHFLHAERCAACHASPPCPGSPDLVLGLGGNRPRARCPHGGDRPNSHTILQLHLAQRFTPCRLIAIACVCQHNADGNPRRFGLSHLTQRNIGLGLKLNFRRHPRLLPPLPILGPLLRQVQLPSDGQAASLAGQRHTDRHLTIVLLAQLPAVLARHSHRLAPLLGKSRVVDDPIELALAPKLGRHPIAHTGQNRRVRPLRLRHQMMQRLMFRADMQWIGMRRQRFHALSFDRQHQPSAVVGKPGMTIPMAQNFAQSIDVTLEFSKTRHEYSPPTRISMHNTTNLLTQ